MPESSRRKFLTIAGVGTAAGLATIAAPNASAAARDESETLPPDAEGAMAAYIHDVRKGEVMVMVEGHEFLVTDHKLVARLARAFARASAR